MPSLVTVANPDIGNDYVHASYILKRVWNDIFRLDSTLSSLIADSFIRVGNSDALGDRITNKTALFNSSGGMNDNVYANIVTYLMVVSNKLIAIFGPTASIMMTDSCARVGFSSSACDFSNGSIIGPGKNVPSRAFAPMSSQTNIDECQFNRVEFAQASYQSLMTRYSFTALSRIVRGKNPESTAVIAIQDERGICLCMFAFSREIASQTMKLIGGTGSIAKSQVVYAVDPANSTSYVNEAKTYRDEAKTYRNEAKTYRDEALAAETNAETAETNAETAENNAETAENNAKFYASDSSANAVTAVIAANNAATSATNAATSATNAATSATNAATAATNAATAATNAATSATNAEGSADTVSATVKIQAFQNAVMDLQTASSNAPTDNNGTINNITYTIVAGEYNYANLNNSVMLTADTLDSYFSAELNFIAEGLLNVINNTIGATINSTIEFCYGQYLVALTAAYQGKTFPATMLSIDGTSMPAIVPTDVTAVETIQAFQTAVMDLQTASNNAPYAGAINNITYTIVAGEYNYANLNNSVMLTAGSLTSLFSAELNFIAEGLLNVTNNTFTNGATINSTIEFCYQQYIVVLTAAYQNKPFPVTMLSIDGANMLATAPTDVTAVETIQAFQTAVMDLQTASNNAPADNTGAINNITYTIVAGEYNYVNLNNIVDFPEANLVSLTSLFSAELNFIAEGLLNVTNNTFTNGATINSTIEFCYGEYLVALTAAYQGKTFPTTMLSINGTTMSATAPTDVLAAQAAATDKIVAFANAIDVIKGYADTGSPVVNSLDTGVYMGDFMYHIDRVDYPGYLNNGSLRTYITGASSLLNGLLTNSTNNISEVNDAYNEYLGVLAAAYQNKSQPSSILSIDGTSVTTFTFTFIPASPDDQVQ